MLTAIAARNIATEPCRSWVQAGVARQLSRAIRQVRISPRPAEVPLIDPRLYQILLSECEENCPWTSLRWHDCIRLGSSRSYTNRIPRRKQDIEDLLEAGAGIAFGIEADYLLSLRILAAYHLAAIVPAFVFWTFWMSNHPGDWQNASVPLMTVLALTTVFWLMAGKRLGIS